MKKLFVAISLLFALPLFAAETAQAPFNVTITRSKDGEKAPEATESSYTVSHTIQHQTIVGPPAKFTVRGIEIYNNLVNYDVQFRNDATSMRFSANEKGKLVSMALVLDDHFISARELSEIQDRNWVEKDVRSIGHTYDVLAWAEFFAAKVASKVPITIRQFGIVSVETASDKSTRLYEFIGRAQNAKGGSQILIRQVGTSYIRAFEHDDFLVAPPEDRKFQLGKLNGKYCAVEGVGLGEKQTHVVAFTTTSDDGR